METKTSNATPSSEPQNSTIDGMQKMIEKMYAEGSQPLGLSSAKNIGEPLPGGREMVSATEFINEFGQRCQAGPPPTFFTSAPGSKDGPATTYAERQQQAAEAIVLARHEGEVQAFLDQRLKDHQAINLLKSLRQKLDNWEHGRGSIKSKILALSGTDLIDTIYQNVFVNGREFSQVASDPHFQAVILLSTPMPGIKISLGEALIRRLGDEREAAEKQLSDLIRDYADLFKSRGLI